jgi:hypothetical protein
MGCRGNIFVKDSTNKISTGVYLYTHWRGDQVRQILKDALKQNPDRWDDEPYLTRIIFSQMIKDDVESTTGYGISTYETDNENPIPHVDCGLQKVKIGDEEWSFKDFCNQGV